MTSTPRAALLSASPVGGAAARLAGSTTLALSLAILAGAWLRIHGIGADPLWVDEASSVAFARQPLPELWGAAARLETNPPLYYSFLHAWIRLFGDSEAAVRSLSAVCSILMIPAIYWLGRTLGGVAVGLVAAWILATAPIQVEYAQEARGYALLGLAAVVALAGLARLLTDPPAARLGLGSSLRRRRGLAAKTAAAADVAWLAYAAGTATCLYVHNTAAFLPLIANLVVLAWWLTVGGRDRVFLVSWLAANAVPFLLWCWWLPIAIEQTLGALGAFWIPELTLRRGLETFYVIYGQRFAVDLVPALLPAAHLLNLLLPLLGAYGAWRWRRDPLRLGLVLAFLAGPPLLIALVSLWTPIWITRLHLWPAVLAYVLAAVGLLAVRGPALRAALLTVLLLVQMAGVAVSHSRPAKEPWDIVAGHLGEQAMPGDALLFLRYGNVLAAFDYYRTDEIDGLPRYAFMERPVPPRVDRPGRPVTFERLTDLVAAEGRLWVVGRHCDRKEPCQAALERLGTVATVERTLSAGPLTVLRVEARGAGIGAGAP